MTAEVITEICTAVAGGIVAIGGAVYGIYQKFKSQKNVEKIEEQKKQIDDMEFLHNSTKRNFALKCTQCKNESHDCLKFYKDIEGEKKDGSR